MILCRDCGEEMIIKQGRFGENFWGCPDHPGCNYTEDLVDNDDFGERQDEINLNRNR